MIISQSISLVVKDLIFLLIIYSLMSASRINLSPLFYQEFMSSARSDRNTVIGHYLLLSLEKLVICCAYNDPRPPPAVGGIGL